MLTALYSHFGTACGPKPRLNFAGGEPLLHAGRVLAAMRLARSIGFDVSLITNGSQLNEHLAVALAPELSLLGISIDGASRDVVAAVGRHDSRGRLLDQELLAKHVTLAKRINPSLALKINTVVNAANWQHDMSALIHKLLPSRWKVLRMLPVVSRALETSSEQFHAFVQRHQAFAHVMCVEDNEDMSGSYIMADPHGRFFQNRVDGPGYDYSPPILEIGATKAVGRIGWSAERFEWRYRMVGIAVGV